ncbi:MAG: alpha/beta fold hydrolase [Nitrospirae bacterium]|nr:alpha/beta fold hydrolase [Magnetococcales bacterium]
MRKRIFFCLAVVIFLSSRNAQADPIILIHGYLGSAQSWQTSGVVPLLQSQGWPLGGILIPEPPWILPYPKPTRTNLPANTIYLAQLPSLAPIALQTTILETQLAHLGRAYPNQKLILVGHSAGGVVARMALVRARIPPIKALITIATPHLGTPRAEQALDEISDPWPMEIIKEFFVGGPYPLLRNSSSLLVDLTRPVPGSMLFALNNTPHPKIGYFSLVRSQPFVLGDSLVPGFSQNMNNIPALSGKSVIIPTVGEHPLNPGDGFILATLLHQLTAKR